MGVSVRGEPPAIQAGAGSLVLASACHGAIAWSTYLVVEHVLYTLGPLLLGWNNTLGPLQWRAIVTLAACFACLGCFAGGLVGLAVVSGQWLGLLGRIPRDGAHLRRMATLVVALAFGVNNLLVHPFGKTEAVSIFTSVLLIIGLTIGEASTRWRKHLAFLGNSWTAAFLLLVGGWTGRVALIGKPVIVKFCSAIVALIVVAAIGALGARFWRARRFPSTEFFPVRAAEVLALAAFVALGASSLLSRDRPSVPTSLVSRAGLGRPNVVLVTMDTVRADHLSLYGYSRETTPNLIDLSRGATVYANAIATADLTLPTHASLFTGLYASWHGAYPDPAECEGGCSILREHPTVGQILSASGYRTMAVVANYGNLAPRFGFARGFQVYDWRMPGLLEDSILLRRGVERCLEGFIPTPVLDVKARRADEITRESAELLKQAVSNGTPFFLFVNYLDAHVPYHPPPPFDGLFPGRHSIRVSRSIRRWNLKS